MYCDRKASYMYESPSINIVTKITLFLISTLTNWSYVYERTTNIYL